MEISKFLKFSVINEFNLFNIFEKSDKPKPPIPIYKIKRRYLHSVCFGSLRLLNNEFSKINVLRYKEELPDDTYGYILESIEYGYTEYYLFESIHGQQTILKDGYIDIEKMSDDAINRIIYDNVRDQNLLDIAKIEEIFLELIDNGCKVEITKLDDGWKIHIELHKTKDKSWKTFSKMKKDLTIISECLDRIVTIYGFDPTTEIKYPWVEIILRNPFE
jgi:hypothetical protein